MRPARLPPNTSPHRPTATLYLVRHGEAESRSRWAAPDTQRPLTRQGVEQSRLIAAHLVDLAGRPPARLLSSPALRCRQTMEPLAAAARREIVEADWLDEGSDPGHAFGELSSLVTRLDPPSGLGGPVTACSHGDVVLGILDCLRGVGVDLGPRPEAPKGGVWIVSGLGAGVPSASLYEPDEVPRARA